MRARWEIKVWPCNNDYETVRIPKPEFPVIGDRVHFWLLQNFRAECGCPINSRVEFVGLKPKKYAVAIRLYVRIPHVRMLVRVPVVKLQDHSALVDDLLIVRATMAALAPENSLVPAATHLNVANGNEWLSVH